MIERNKILVIGPPKSGKFTLIKNIFKSLPNLPTGASHSGVIHDVELKTKYFSKNLQIWIDEFDNDDDDNKPDHPNNELSSLQKFMKWSNEFRSPQMKEIRDVISGIIFCIDYNNHDYEGENDIQIIVNQLQSIIKTLKKDEKVNTDLANQLESIDINKSNINDEDAELYDLYEPWNGFMAAVIFERKDSLEKPKIDKAVIKDVFIDNNLDFAYYKENVKFDSLERDEFGDRLGVYKIQDIIETFDWNDVELKVPSYHYLTNDESEKELSKPLRENGTEKDSINNLDIGEILNKVKAAKENATNISNPQLKEKFANDFINDIINLI